MYAMGEQLTSVLELINIGGRSCAGKNMRIVIIEDVLHFLWIITLKCGAKNHNIH